MYTQSPSIFYKRGMMNIKKTKEVCHVVIDPSQDKRRDDNAKKTPDKAIPTARQHDTF